MAVLAIKHGFLQVQANNYFRTSAISCRRMDLQKDLKVVWVLTELFTRGYHLMVLIYSAELKALTEVLTLQQVRTTYLFLSSYHQTDLLMWTARLMKVLTVRYLGCMFRIFA